MKGSFCFKLFKMLCLPPCPKNIIEHAAFQPPAPTYSLEFDNASSNYSFDITRKSLEMKLNSFYSTPIPYQAIEVFFATTKYSTKIACTYYRVNPTTKITILYSHGNASDLGTVTALSVWLAEKVRCNILAYDYTGYGRSSGKPSEKKIYADIEAAYNILREKYHCAPEDIILMGQSLGSAPTLDLASKVKVRGVIVQSGFISALNVAFGREEPKSMCCDVFDNGGKVNRVTSPVLVIHGDHDDVIDISHGIAIYERCQNAVEPLWIQGAGHNDIELYFQFTDRIKKFINVELPASFNKESVLSEKEDSK